MKKIICYALAFVWGVFALTGCNKNEEPKSESSDTIILEQTDAIELEERSISQEQALAAIKKYCYNANPDLENIVNEGQYPVYWEVYSSDENEIVILFRSYTGAQNRYYIDRNTGDTYITEFVPAIMEAEERTDESFNVKDFLIDNN